MIGVIANTVGVLIGSAVGLIAKKAIPESWTDIIIRSMGLISIYVGVTGMFDGEKTLVLVVSMVLGAMIGQGLDLDGHFNMLAAKLQSRFQKEGQESTFAQGMITATLIFCVGAMSVVGPLDAAMKGTNDILFTKSVMDTVTSIMLAASLGIGVMFSAAPVLILEGGVFLLAAAVAPFLSTSVVAEMTCAGSLLIVALGLNLVKATDLKVMNYLPAIFLPVVLVPAYDGLISMLG